MAASTCAAASSSASRVRFLEGCYLAQADERPGVLGLIAEGIDDLVKFSGADRHAI